MSRSRFGALKIVETAQGKKKAMLHVIIKEENITHVQELAKELHERETTVGSMLINDAITQDSKRKEKKS